MSGLKRERPTRSRNHRVTVRDLALLLLVGKAGIVTARQAARYVGASYDAAVKRLHALCTLGYLRVVVPGRNLNERNRYLLTPRGRELLAVKTGRDRADFRVRAGIERVNLEAADGIIDVYIALALAAARSQSIELREFAFEADIRARTGSKQGARVPDAVAVLQVRGGAMVALAVEVDGGGESPSWVATKMADYAALRVAGSPLMGCQAWRVAIVVPTVRRLHRLARAIWSTPAVPEGFVYLGHDSAVTDRTVLAVRDSPWLTPREESSSGTARLVAECPLEPFLTNPPYHPEGQVRESISFLLDRDGESSRSFASAERP